MDRGVSNQLRSSGAKVRSASSPPSKERRRNIDTESQSSDDEYSTPTAKEENKKLLHTKGVEGNQMYNSATTYTDHQLDNTSAAFLSHDSKQMPKNVHNKNITERGNRVWTLVGIASVILAIFVLILICFTYSDDLRPRGPRAKKTLDMITDDIGRDLDVLRAKTQQDKSFWYVLLNYY